MIISDEPRAAAARAVRRAEAVAAALVTAIGVGAAIYYAAADLTLSHYDARGHLIVARRVIDSLTPGWQQIGAVWLPLPHLLNLLPVQIDAFYRAGYSAIAISVASSALAAYALAAIVRLETRSSAAAVAAALVLALNPNTLYLQSTPMTEPLLLGLVLVSTLLMRNWVATAGTTETANHREHSEYSDSNHWEHSGHRVASGRGETAAGIAIFLACWTRYEAWPMTGALLALAWLALVRLGAAPREATLRVLRIARYPAAAVVLFLINSRITVGAWFVASGFFVPDNPALHDPLWAGAQVLGGAARIAGLPLVVAGIAGAIVIVVLAVIQRDRASALLALAPFGMAALPWYAFLQGHPYRVRYMVVQVASLALAGGLAIGLLKRRIAAPGVLALLALCLSVRPPLDRTAAMVREAQWDRPNAAGRAQVTAYLSAHHDGTPIMASMGSLGHYMQELSLAGFDIRDFLHEGNGDLWKAALATPYPHVRWILVEEKAEGGDMLAERARRDPAFLSGFSRAASGGGVALYVRTAPPS